MWEVVETIAKVNRLKFVETGSDHWRKSTCFPPTAIPGIPPPARDLASDRVLYPRDRPRNVITGRNPQRTEYQTGPTAH